MIINQRRRSGFPTHDHEEFEPDSESKPMNCISCKEEYEARDAGTCKECYEEASETEEELKREIEDLKSKVMFLRILSPTELNLHGPCESIKKYCIGGGGGGGGGFTDVVLVASSHEPPLSVPAHKAVLVSRSPVFKAMLENEMEESRSGTIRISDVSFDVLRSFVNYLYTAEASVDEQMACELLILAEKYQVQHLKNFCEKFLVSRLNWDNAIMMFVFARQLNAKNVIEPSLALIIDNMYKLTKQKEYMELVQNDPRLVVEIYEAYLARQVNTAANKNQTAGK